MTAWEAGTLFTAATALACVGVAGMRRWALRRNLLDIPNQRSSHSRPTPRGGGLAIVLVTLAGWLGLPFLCPSQASPTVLAAYACGAGLIALVGWLDDLYSLSVKTRFAAHGLAALAAVAALGYWQTAPILPGLDLGLGYAGAAVTLIWIVGLTNAYNFMDGSDGIAGIQALVAALGWTCIGWLAGNPLVTHLALLLAACSAGFLFHNWPPARIFMGDVGSAFLGYSFAILPLLGMDDGGRLASASPVLGLLPVWPFVFDTALTFLRRLRHGENVFAAHRSHLYQRLLIAGHSHRFVMLLYGALASVGAAAAALRVVRPAEVFWCSSVLFPSLAAALWAFVVAEERRARDAVPTVRILPMPSSKRRAA